jgi:hypothetical protein
MDAAHHLLQRHCLRAELGLGRLSALGRVAVGEHAEAGVPLVGAIIGVRTSRMLMVVKVTPWSANSLAAQRVHASSAALLAT